VGITASLMLIINPIINTFIYEHMKDLLLPLFDKNDDEIIYFISGAFSKFISTIATYPY